MRRQYIGQLADGQSLDEVYLVGDKQLRANRNGVLFIQLDLRDRTGGMSARLWNAGEQLFRTFEPGDFVHITGKVQLFQGSLQIILHTLEREESEKVELTDFLPHTEHDVGQLLEKLRAHLRKVGNPHLRALAECFLMDDEFLRDFCHAPAGVRNHHATVGGLLEHTVNLLELADRVAPLFPGVDRDLLAVGVFLHDAGKVRELSYKRSFAYTDEGQLIGHLVIGVEMVTEKANLVPELTGEPLPRELVLRVKHMILSHHGQYDYGSPKLPMTPEAMALAALDAMDAKVYAYTREIREDRNASSAWTPYNASLGRRLFKGGHDDDGSTPATPEGID